MGTSVHATLCRAAYCGEDVEHHAALDEVVECDGAAPRPIKLPNQ